jgi:polyphosphate kinase
MKTAKINYQYINRELSWLQFNERVLQEAADKRNPLLSRIKFLGIFSNNLDEFFRVRVATLHRLAAINREVQHTLGFNPKKTLNEIQKIVLTQQTHFEAIYADICHLLSQHRIFIVNETQLSPEQGNRVRTFFHDVVRPLLVPLMLDEIPDFPELRDGRIYLALHLRKHHSKSKPHYALIELPPPEKLSRFFVLEQSEKGSYVMLLDDVVRYCLSDMFAIFGYDDCKAYTVKITQDAEFSLDADVSKSFLELLSIGIKKRKQGRTVRFIYDSNIKPDLLGFITKKLGIKKEDNIIGAGRYHNFKDFMLFPKLGPPELDNRPNMPLPHPDIDPQKSLFTLIKQRDVLLHFPYHAYHPIIDFLREAAIDPKTRFIKITLYRVARQSNIINALINARRNGKEVTVVIELQARFDEAANIEWAKTLQEAGIIVIHGQQGIKIHSKMCLVGRKEGKNVCLYANISTGNYHESTARLYADDSLLTADPSITQEIAKLFHHIESRLPVSFKHLLVSPMQMVEKLFALIDREINNAKQGKKAYIIAKLNSLSDESMIDKLYEASAAGVRIQLIVRGICSLIPQMKNMSDNIEVISIVDKYLEHSRIYVFANNGDEQYYIASADWMERNLYRRIEIACPIYDPKLQAELRFMLQTQWNDNTKSRLLNCTVKNEYRSPKQAADAPIRAQNVIYDYFKNKLNAP